MKDLAQFTEPGLYYMRIIEPLMQRLQPYWAIGFVSYSELGQELRV